MDSEKKGLGTLLFKGAPIRAVKAMAKKLDKRRDSVERWINDALAEDLTPEEFEERVVEYLTLLYENRVTGLSKSEDDIKREAARITASYEYRKNHPEEKKEEDLNNAAYLERKMDMITGIYEPMLQNIGTKAEEYISKLGIPEDDSDIELTPSVVDTILKDTEGLVKSISDFKYLIERKFKDVVSFAALNRRYKELTGKEYASDPNRAFRELTTKLYSQLQVQLNAIALALNDNFDELDKAGITDRERVSAFENIDKLLSTLDRLYENAKLDPSLSSLTSSILEKDDLKAAVEARLAKIKINGEPTRTTGEPEPEPEPSDEHDDSHTFRDDGPEKRTPWYKRTIEKLKGILPTRDKKEKGERKGPRTPIFGGAIAGASSVITVKLSEDEIKELITRYKARISEFNEKAEKFNDLNVAIKAQYGGMTATSVEEIYDALKTFTFVSSYEEIAKLEQQARSLRQEMDSIEVGILSDRIKYLGATGRVLSSVEELKELKLNQPKGVLETSAVLEFVTAHDKNRLVIEHRLNEIAVELTDSALSPERKAELEKEKGKLEQYFISENSIITRAVVEACQADRSLSVDKINEQRKEKFKEIKEEILAKLAKRKPGPDRPGDDTYDWSSVVREKAKPILDEFGYDILKMEGLEYGAMMNYINYLSVPATRETFKNNVSIFKELGLEDQMYEKKYHLLLINDTSLKPKYEALKEAGISKEEIVDKWLKPLFDRSISLEMLKAEIAKAKASDKPLTEEEERAAILAKFSHLNNYSVLQKAELESLRLLNTVPEDLIKKNDKFLSIFGLSRNSICNLLTTIELEEKFDYLYALSKDNTILSIVGHEKESLEEFKVYCEKAMGDFISYMKSNYDLDYSVVPVEKQGEFVRYYEDIQIRYIKRKVDNNIPALQSVFSNEEIVSTFKIFDLFHSHFDEMINEMKAQGLTDEEIRANTKLLIENYKADPEFIKAVANIIIKRKTKTPEAEKAEILEKLKHLGFRELEECGIEKLRRLAEADSALIEKNAEYIRSHGVPISSVSICDFLTCEDFDKKYEFLKSVDEKINIHDFILTTKDLPYEEFKAYFKEEVDLFIKNVKNDCGIDVTKCKNINDIELIKYSKSYKDGYSKKLINDNVRELQDIFTLEEIVERFGLGELFTISIRKNLEAMRSRGLTDEEIKANYELLTVVSPDYSVINKKIDEIIAARTKAEEPEEPKLEGSAISEGKIELGRLRFRSSEPEDVDRDKDAVERNVPMLRVEVYKNGIRVELYKEVKEQLKKLQVKVALVGKNKDGEWSKRAVAGTTTKIKPGEAVDIIQEDFDPEKYALSVQSSYKDGDDYSEHKDTIRIR